ncbi:MAG: FAD-dependent thymidylate synthase [Candidatus Woesearchaeota archaeon]
MVNVIDPKVNVFDYGPKKVLERELDVKYDVNEKGDVIISREYLKDGKLIFPEEMFREHNVITPDEFVWGAAGITYKDIGAIDELRDLKSREVDLSSKITTSLIKSAGAGHASMATTPGIWAMLEGTCSKLVDSMFTGSRFGSFLMPSGRRVPINRDQIVVPKSINNAGGEALKLYLRTSEANILAYEELQERGVTKQEASKIVQYGHRGGGFICMPLESIINFSASFRNNVDEVPAEGREIILQLEQFINEHGIKVTHNARRNAPRTGVPNPNIFTNKTNLAHELIEKNYDNSQFNPVLMSVSNFCSEKMDARIYEYYRRRNAVFHNLDRIKTNSTSLLKELDLIVHDYDTSVHAVTLVNTPWRVWGEVKRHRTLPQTVESVYHALERASRVVNRTFIQTNFEDFDSVVSIPDSVRNNRENREYWLNRFSDSVSAYEKLLEMGIPKSDAIAVIPRGLKLGVVKEYGLYNLSLGYMSLRLCKTAEPEMRKITEMERELIRNSNISESVKQLIAPKCHYVGFCPDTEFCKRIKKYDGVDGPVSRYNQEFHLEMKKSIKDSIREEL